MRDVDDDSGCGAVAPQAEGSVQLGIAAVKLYAADAITAAIGRRNTDGGQALRDLRSSNQRYLRTLCEPLGADVEAVSRMIERCIKDGEGAGVRAKPRKHQAKAA
ncbi:hypothetical protein HLB35_15890 [Halomonas sp. TBZ9]|uniref:Uncharacterized protein n=1 Tax=Vreelandella azerica TaxID=2732867 RepID=A0A7Y3TZ35_9GAMM|nr:hypothetical protein [Halomonas azerica]NOG32876.1 hypothetical protein [Halomonas azerica]